MTCNFEKAKGRDWTVEVVNGVVIGEVETREYYRFFSAKDGRLLWDAGLFDNDQMAEKTFWDKMSVDPWLVSKYKAEGVEMRVRK